MYHIHFDGFDDFAAYVKRFDEDFDRAEIGRVLFLDARYVLQNHVVGTDKDTPPTGKMFASHGDMLLNAITDFCKASPERLEFFTNTYLDYSRYRFSKLSRLALRRAIYLIKTSL
jgi:hypothetical protein